MTGSDDGDRVQDRTAFGAREVTQAGDFGGYLRRNLSTAYRLTAMALDDPITAQDVVHDAAMEGWRVGSTWPVPALDAAFRRALDAGCRAALKAAVQTSGSDEGSLAAALLSLSAGDRLALAMDFGLRQESPRGWSGPGSRSSPGAIPAGVRERLEAGRRELAADHEGQQDALLEARLRALYVSRDPGEEVPLSLRLRLQRSLFEAESAAAERDEIARSSGWGFAINTFLAILAVTIAIALASVTGLRASQAQDTGSPGGPTSPLTITSVSVVLGGIDGPDVHVAATRDSLLAAFQGSSDWHPEPRQCLGDVTGLIDTSGQAQWLGQPVGHVQAITGDPLSNSVFTSGIGEYCTLGRHSSADGGSTWTAEALPPGAAASPTWLSFDPTRAETLLTADGAHLFLSRDAGATWTTNRETVAPIGFDSTGRLFGWAPGELFESTDEGATWQQIGVGPAAQPIASTGLRGGVLVGGPDGVWWFPLNGEPSLVRAGSVFSIAPAGDGAVAVGSDGLGRPWLGTFSSTATALAFREASLPPGVASLHVSGGQVAANDSGAVVAFSGASSVIAFAGFAR